MARSAVGVVDFAVQAVVGAGGAGVVVVEEVAGVALFAGGVRVAQETIGDASVADWGLLGTSFEVEAWLAF
jgi:hypothetical protein